MCLASQSVPNASETKTLSARILKALEQEDLNSRQLLNQLKCTEMLLVKSLSELVEINKIEITATNTYKKL